LVNSENFSLSNKKLIPEYTENDPIAETNQVYKHKITVPQEFNLSSNLPKDKKSVKDKIVEDQEQFFNYYEN